MKKIGKVVFILFLLVLGLGSVVLGVVLCTQVQDWIAIGFAVAIVAFGIATLTSAWTVARGRRMREVLEDLFLGLP